MKVKILKVISFGYNYDEIINFLKFSSQTIPHYYGNIFKVKLTNQISNHSKSEI